MNTLPLHLLRKFALAHSTRLFHLADHLCCLAAQTANSYVPGHVMTGWTGFVGPPGGYNEVDHRFASLCRELDYRGHTDVSGADLAAMIVRIEDGTHPRQVADEYADATDS